MGIQHAEYGRAAYEAYRISLVVSNSTEYHVIPAWDNLSPEIKKAWRAAANQVVRETIDWYRQFLTDQLTTMPR